jgi:integrase
MTKSRIVDYDFVKKTLVDTGLRESSAKTYVSNMKRILKMVFETTTPKISLLKKEQKTLIETVSNPDSFKNANVRKVILMSLAHLYEVYDLKIEPFENPTREFTRLADAESVANTTAETIEKIEGIDFDVIKETIQDQKDPTDRLITALYSYLPPLRMEDYINLQVVNPPRNTQRGRSYKEPEGNHINLKSNNLVLKNYKTSNYHGTRTIAIPFKLAEEIQRYLKSTGNRKLLPLSSSAFNRRMNRLFGASVNTFRKAYVSQFAPKMTAQQLSELSQILGHKISTQMLSYRKNIKNKNDNEQPDENAETDTEEIETE